MLCFLLDYIYLTGSFDAFVQSKFYAHTLRAVWTSVSVTSRIILLIDYLIGCLAC